MRRSGFVKTAIIMAGFLGGGALGWYACYVEMVPRPVELEMRQGPSGAERMVTIKSGNIVGGYFGESKAVGVWRYWYQNQNIMDVKQYDMEGKAAGLWLSYERDGSVRMACCYFPEGTVALQYRRRDDDGITGGKARLTRGADFSLSIVFDQGEEVVEVWQGGKRVHSGPMSAYQERAVLARALAEKWRAEGQWLDALGEFSEID